MIFKLGELFCGPGGLAWGATHADIGNPNFKITTHGLMTMMRILVRLTVAIYAQAHQKLFITQTLENLTLQD